MPPTFLTQADVRTVRVVHETAQPAQPAPPDDDLNEEAHSDIEEQFHLNQTDDERLARNELGRILKKPARRVDFI
jgi:hypothetical protein